MKLKLKRMVAVFAAVLPLAAGAASDGLLQNYGSDSAPWLKKLKTWEHRKNAKFRVLQIGDSHTAGDFFTDRLRLRLRQQWGDGGIGWVYPNAVKGQRMATVRYSGTGFQTASSRNVAGDFPLGGVAAKTNGGSITLSAADGSVGVYRVSVFAKPLLAEQGLVFNGREVKAANSGWQLLDSRADLPLTLESSMPWDVGFINIENENKGVTVSAMGINGSQLTHWSKWRPDWSDDLAQTAADLVILAYGTNEAFADSIDIEETEKKWKSYIRQIKSSLPEAGILIVGAPESLKSTSGSCGSRPLRLDEIQQMQRRIAREERVMFWSWQDAMGGACSMKSWMAQGLAAKDGVHFSARGYAQAADKLADSLIGLAD